jgi:hypothetical protein
MQIKIHLSDCASESSENVVQKILAASNARQNEVVREWMYYQVSSMSYCKAVHKSHQYHRHQQPWSLCSVDKLKSFGLTLIKFLLWNLFLILKHGWTILYRRLMKCTGQWLVWNCRRRSKCINSHTYRNHYHHPHTPPPPTVTETFSAHKNLMNDKDLIFLLLLHLTPCLKSTAATRRTFLSNFCTKFYKILLTSLYVHFNSNKGHQFWRYQQQQQLSFNPHGINAFCDLSTNDSRILLFDDEMIYSKWWCRIEHQLTTEKLRRRLNSFFYGILLIQRHLACNNHEFSDNHHERIGAGVKDHHLLLHLLLAHNQMICVTTTPTLSSFSICQEQNRHHHSRHHHLLLAFCAMDNCSVTLSMENAISTLGTSNHKLKVSQSDNDVCHRQKLQHQKVKKKRRRPTFRFNDSVKSHLNAILFLAMLCIPILTTANVHNLKYSTNVVKTKYGPLRGIVLRQNPTVEGYLGVPYGKSFTHLSSSLMFLQPFFPPLDFFSMSAMTPHYHPRSHNSFYSLTHTPDELKQYTKHTHTPSHQQKSMILD